MSGPIPPLPPVTAAPDLVAEARRNCAARSRAKGDLHAAEDYEAGRGEGWGLRHEVAKLAAERGALS